jgi:outer membrane protein OmpA-like peptidoglycan-associated protein
VFRPSVFILLLLPLGTASAALQRYVASEHESVWVTSSSKLYCSLSHEIPIYGKAVFERYAAGNLGMTIEVKRQPHKVGVARLTSTAPSWKHEARERDLGQVNYTAERTAFKLQHIQSRRLLSELEQGMFPTLSYEDWSDGRDEVQVSLSAVNIRASLGEFLDCLSAQLPHNSDYLGDGKSQRSRDSGYLGGSKPQRQLGTDYLGGSRTQLPSGFASLRESKVYFQFDSSLLSNRDMQRLDELADYMLADKRVRGVALYGRTDSKGFRVYNEALGKRRAESVRDYLIDRGVDPGNFSIRLRSYGERRPVASNRTAGGRALNRMVEVNLLK